VKIRSVAFLVAASFLVYGCSSLSYADLDRISEQQSQNAQAEGLGTKQTARPNDAYTQADHQVHADGGAPIDCFKRTCVRSTLTPYPAENYRYTERWDEVTKKREKEINNMVMREICKGC
jgi:hypothetical protein